METKFCQSCGMPLQKNEELGTNHDGLSLYERGGRSEYEIIFPYIEALGGTISLYKKRLFALRPAGLISLECGASSRKSPFLFEWCFS